MLYDSFYQLPSLGVDPIHFYDNKNNHSSSISETILNNNGMDLAMTKSQIQSHLPPKRKTEGLGIKVSLKYIQPPF